MRAIRLLCTDAVTATRYCCAAGPADRPFAECHDGFTLATVRHGSFGYRPEGQAFDLVPGAVLLGHPGAEYVCTHDHHAGGDECLAFTFSPETAAGCGTSWRAGALPPLPAVMVAGALAEAAAAGRTGVGLEEAALGLAAQVLRVRGGVTAEHRAPDPRDRRRAVAAALWLDAHAAGSVDPGMLASAAGLSRYHFLRVFTRVLGVTPHQYLLRARVRRAAKLLIEDDLPVTEIAFATGFGDLSHFIHRFRRAAGVSPRLFRARARADRNFRQAAQAGRAA